MIASERREFDESLPLINPSQHLGSAVKQLTDTQNESIAGKSVNGSSVGTQSVQLERKLGAHHNKILQSLLDKTDVVRGITFATVLGCIVYAALALVRKNLIGAVGGSRWRSSIHKMDQSALILPKDFCSDHEDLPDPTNQTGISGIVKKLLAAIRVKFENSSGAERLQSSFSASLSSSIVACQKERMPVDEAEALVMQWQTIKAEALGPNHQVHGLSDILDEPMLVQVNCLFSFCMGFCACRCLYVWVYVRLS